MTGRSSRDEGRRPARSPLEGTRAAEGVHERDLADEIEAHLGHRVDDLVARGVPEEEALRLARADFGDVERIKEEARRERRRHARDDHGGGAGAAGQDIRWALRQVRRAPGFAVAAISTLLLGIGAAVTISSVVGVVVFEPLPFSEPERIVLPGMLTPEGDPFSVAEPAFLDWRRDVRSFQDVAALHTVSATIRSPGQPRATRVARVSHNLLDVLGLRPTLGRTIDASEDRPAMPGRVALLSHSTWRSDFASDPDMIGSTIDLDGTRHQVIGIAPPELEVLTRDTPILVPLGADPSLDRGEHYLDVVARLAPGATPESAATELEQVQERASRIHSADVGWGTNLRPARDVLIGSTVERAGLVLLFASVLLLIMACVNVSNLLMVRATIRRREMALRAALGATRTRLVGQLFAESGLLALFGGGLGILASYLALPVVKALGTSRIPRLEGAEIDATAVLVGIAAALVATLTCGLAPVVQLRPDRLGNAITAGRSRSGDAGRALRSGFVASQVALTVILLVGTGLLLRSFVQLVRVDPGFEPYGTIAFSVDMPDGSWDRETRATLLPQLREALSSIPGVVAVGATAVEPFSGMALANFAAPEENVPDRASDFTPIQWRVVTPGFFEAMGMQLLAGRGFQESDDWDGGTPVVIGEGLARSLWGATDATGRRLVWGNPEGSHLTVVGVVEDLRDVELGETPLPIIYRPHRQIPWTAMTMVMRLDGVEPTAVAEGIRSRVAETVPGLPIGDMTPLSAYVDRAVAEPRFNLALLSAFAVVGLLLALVGVYGVTAFDVRRRFQEIGIRLSLGARPESIRTMILRQRMVVTSVGLAVGLGVAWLVAGSMEALLFEISPRDPVTWLAVTGLVAAASWVATYLPSRHATRVDPREVLNSE